MEDSFTYDLEIENFPAPVPAPPDLIAASDTGMMNNDNITADNTPTFSFTTSFPTDPRPAGRAPALNVRFTDGSRLLFTAQVGAYAFACDPRCDRRQAVGEPDQGILHVRGQAGDRAAGDPRRRHALAPVAGDLEDRLEPLADHCRVRVEGQAPQMVQPSR